jgi:uncharacterized membrane protein YjgN (DUF898 family)
VAAQTQLVDVPVRLPFRFTGNGWEYFKIWIANLCLSILTLGIYSAWAKVRRVRYFWGNTRLADASFDYLARPIAILKGRLLVVAFFALYSATSVVLPAAQPVVGLLLLVLVPWAVVRALVFRARNTAYRNIRFNFLGDYGDAFRVYVVIPILMAFTLGLIYPYLVHQQKQLVLNHSAYGTSRFRLGSGVGGFYRLFARVLLLLTGALGATVLLFGIGVTSGVALPLVAVPGVLLYLFLFAYVRAGVSNLTYGGAALEEHTFQSDLRAAELFGLYVTNVLGILLTAGLFIPWARVRVARYRVEHLALRPSGDLDSFVAEQLDEVGSAGDELGGLLDIDIGL